MVDCESLQRRGSYSIPANNRIRKAIPWRKVMETGILHHFAKGLIFILQELFSLIILGKYNRLSATRHLLLVVSALRRIHAGGKTTKWIQRFLVPGP